MKVLELGDLPLNEPTFVTIGGFDGIHRGHAEVLNQLVLLSNGNGCKSCVVTFKVPPKVILNGWESGIITPVDEKLRILSRERIDYVLLLEFDEELKSTTAERFTKEVIINGLKGKGIVIGFNHRFGKGREGGADFLARNLSEFGISLYVVPPLTIGKEVVSASKIRELIWEGKVEKAGTMLGRPFSIRGKVIEGRGFGKRIGFPTANISPPLGKLIPKEGVYLSEVKVEGKKYRGVTNVGRRPTFGEGKTQIETHILNFSREIRGLEIEVSFIKRIRGEKKFASLEELRAAIEKDIELARGCENPNF